MKGSFAVARPEYVEFTASFTGTLGEWRAIAAALDRVGGPTALQEMRRQIQGMTAAAESKFEAPQPPGQEV